MSNGRRFTGMVLLTVVAATVSWCVIPVSACPFCDAPTTTFSEQIATSDAVLLVDWVSDVKPDPLNFTDGSTTFRVVKSLPGKAGSVKADDLIKLNYYISGTPGLRHWILGTAGKDQTNWSLPSRVTEDCWEYIKNAPSRDAASSERLRYYLKYLEHSDPEIAIDAFGEFAGAPYSALVEIRKDLDRAKVLSWLQNPEQTPMRLGLYGLMLGLCGNAEDAVALEAIVLKPADGTRLGIDGMMAGYVLLTGEPGFRKLVNAKLGSADAVPSETNAMLQLLRFLWEYAPEVAPRDLLKQAMRMALNQPPFASVVIIDLARWKDWEIAPALVGVYGQEPYADADTKKAIIRFLKLASETKEIPGESVSPTVQFARDSLARIRVSDPDTIKALERREFD